MKKEAKTETNDQATSSRRPSHIAYWVKDRGEEKASVWRPIGVAWEHGDGKGFNVTLDLQPLDGRITLRVQEDKTE